MSAAVRVEELFLKLFKYALLLAMGLSLIGALIFSGHSVFNYLTQPVPPTPAQEPPKENILLENFLQKISPPAKSEGEGHVKEVSTAGDTRRKLFHGYAASLVACSDEFSKAVGQQANATAETRSSRIEVLGDALMAAEQRAHLGSEWGPALVSFACEAMRDPKTIDFKKRNPDVSVFFPLLDYHRTAWVENMRRAEEFRDHEHARVEREEQKESVRVAVAKQQALVSLAIVGGLLVLFGLLALYLIFARIEVNLRGIAGVGPTNVDLRQDA